MNTNNQNQELPLVVQDNTALAVNGLPVKKYLRLGLAKWDMLISMKRRMYQSLLMLI